MDFKVLNDETKAEAPVTIIVIGAGGGGSNAVDGMIERGIKGVRFVTINTDVQDLRKSKAEIKTQIGAQLTGGRGAGGVPEVGEKAALENKEQISKMLEGADMVFITAGMGGGTGTGSAPVIAQIAKDQGILTVGVVTKPFEFEKAFRMEQAEKGIEKLRKAVDTLIVIPNQKLLNNVDRKTSIVDAFRKANEVLCQGVQGISDSIIQTGLINIDFADVETVMRDQGDALMAIGYGTGENRVEEAVSGVLDNPLLEDTSIKGATKALIYVASGEEFPLVEYDDVIKRITADMDKGVNIIAGLYLDPSLGEKIKVTLIAAGFAKEPEKKILEVVRTAKNEIINAKDFENMCGNGPIPGFLPPRDKSEDYKYSDDDLDVPTVIRDRRFINFANGNQGTVQSN